MRSAFAKAGSKCYILTAASGPPTVPLQAELAADSSAKTFAYVAHEAVHGPLEVPLRSVRRMAWTAGLDVIGY